MLSQNSELEELRQNYRDLIDRYKNLQQLYSEARAELAKIQSDKEYAEIGKAFYRGISGCLNMSKDW